MALYLLLCMVFACCNGLDKSAQFLKKEDLGADVDYMAVSRSLGECLMNDSCAGISMAGGKWNMHETSTEVFGNKFCE